MTSFKTKLYRLVACSILTVFLLSAAQAQLKLASIFMDHMVLQQQMAVPVWGTAGPGQKITVRFAMQSKEAITDENGNWKVLLPAMNYSSKGNDLAVSDGMSSIKIEDVLVGEVWLCSGQSNMGMSVAELQDADKVIAAANHPLLRMFKVPQTPALNPRTTVDSKWVACTPSTANTFSAMGYYFASRLQEKLNVPVGIVVCAWGGSSVFAWLSKEAIAAPALRPYVPYDLLGYFENHRPKLLYNGMLHPLIPYAVKGVIWYQGETDAMDERFNPYLYRYAFHAMIDDWRQAWKRKDMPFYFVQLPNLYGGKWWPVLRESQDIVHREVKNTGMITTIDIGQSRKLHPGNKYQFGYRMADLVLGEQYHAKPVRYAAFGSMKIDRDKIKVALSDADGLKTLDGASPLGFEIAGADQVFKPATARIEGTGVLVWNKDVTAPVAVRYAFVPDPKINLVNADQLPVRPFRTDTWDVYGRQLMAQSLTAKDQLETNCSPQKIVDSTYKEWRWAGQGIQPGELVKEKMLAKLGAGRIRLQVIGRRNNDAAKESSPSIGWMRSVATPANGLTFEIGVQVARASLPFAGFSLCAGIQDNNKVNVYNLNIVPLQITASRNEFTYVLANDIDNSDFHRYRLAIRKDGVCQVYYDDQLIGVIQPETLDAKEAPAKGSFILFGKLRNEGDIALSVASVSFDGSGAYSPSSASKK